MAGTVKVEVDVDTCCLCGSGGELMTCEEYDAAAPPMQVPLRTMLLQLNSNKVVPEGRLCSGCTRRAADSYEFATALGSRSAPPLSDKIRALRRRLHQLTQRIDVFIVVGGGAAAGGAHNYSEDDIIVVERDALAAATAADDDLQHAKNAKGDTVYQCSVCPLSFQRVSEYQSHCASHPEAAVHSCWTCGAQFGARDLLRAHQATHAPPDHATCHLCNNSFQSLSLLRRHESSCPPRCPLCGALAGSRGALSRHCGALHGRAAAPPLACPACFQLFAAHELLSAHLLRHRQDKQFVCGYGDCVLRFGTRSNLMGHIRAAHAAELPADDAPAEHACHHCDRTFGSGAALKRHARVHRDARRPGQESADGLVYLEEGDVEYLEVETLEDADADQYSLQDHIMAQ